LDIRTEHRIQTRNITIVVCFLTTHGHRLMTHNMYNLPSDLQRLLCTLKLLSITPLLLLCCIASVNLYFTYPVVRSNNQHLVFHVDTIYPRWHMSVSSFNENIIDDLCTTAELQPSTRQSLDATLDRGAMTTNRISCSIFKGTNRRLSPAW
jgi:hypothetical protein